MVWLILFAGSISQATCHDRKILAAPDSLDLDGARPERIDQRLIERFSPLAVVSGEVADVDIECRAIALGPGMYRQMGFRKNHCAGRPAFLRGVRAVELIEAFAQNGEPHRLAGLNTERTQCCGGSQQIPFSFVPRAMLKVSNDVQPFHCDTPVLCRIPT